jgi:hypothetical protein
VNERRVDRPAYLVKVPRSPSRRGRAACRP